MKLPILLFLALSTAPAAVVAEESPVRVWQDLLPLPTSVELPPDPNPPLEQFRAGEFQCYPYSIRDRLSRDQQLTRWRAVVLENRYLRCTILPDLGGHIYSCIDKVSGQSLFYANRSIKKALVSYRGAWAAFGVEFNFPVSHNYVSVSPVDFSYGIQADGSAAVAVGNVDRVDGMQWIVQLVLRPDRAVLEQHVTLVNRDQVRHRYFWWTNAAVEVRDDSRVAYPMRFTEGHGLADIDTWPVDSQGVDLSVVGNHRAGTVSRFVHGSAEAYCGIYHPSTRTGVAHYADHRALPGKKIWSWGSNARGRHFRTALSDDESAYVELQAGLLRNQETYAFLEPAQAIHFSEYWMPVRDTGGITRANPNGVLALRRLQTSSAGADLLAALNITQSEPRATILLLDGDRVVSREETALDPARTWTHTWPRLPPERSYTLRVQSASGATLIEHTENTFDWTPADQVTLGPITPPATPPQERWTGDDFLREGTNLELNGQPVKAWETYEAGLQRYPSESALQKAAGRLAVPMLRYERAVELLGAASARAPRDGEMRYYLGLAQAALQHDPAAVEQLKAALDSPTLRAAASLRLAELAARAGDLPEAVRRARQAADWAPDDLRTGAALVGLLRLGGDLAAAREGLRSWISRYPLDNVLRYENAMLGTDTGELWLSLAADANRLLDLTDHYLALGAWAEGEGILQHALPEVTPEQREPGEPPPARDPLVRYYLGYVRAHLGHDAPSCFRAAADLPPLFVAPNRARALEVLSAALEANPEDANAHHLLGELLFSRGLTDAALSHWRQAMAIDPRLPGPAYCLGRALLVVKHEPGAAAEILEKASQADPANAGVFTALNAVMEARNAPAADRAAMLERFPGSAEMPDKFAQLLIDTLRAAGRTAEAEKIERQHRFTAKE